MGNGFRSRVLGTPIELSLSDDGERLVDAATRSTWDLLGRPQSGPFEAPLDRLPVSDEYWFSWRFFRPDVPLRRLGD